MKAGIVIDNWKLSIFERHLKEGGFTPTLTEKKFTPDSLFLSVVTDDVEGLQKVVAAANLECARMKLQ